MAPVCVNCQVQMEMTKESWRGTKYTCPKCFTSIVVLSPEATRVVDSRDGSLDIVFEED